MKFVGSEILILLCKISSVTFYLNLAICVSNNYFGFTKGKYMEHEVKHVFALLGKYYFKPLQCVIASRVTPVTPLVLFQPRPYHGDKAFLGEFARLEEMLGTGGKTFRISLEMNRTPCSPLLPESCSVWQDHLATLIRKFSRPLKGRLQYTVNISTERILQFRARSLWRPGKRRQLLLTLIIIWHFINIYFLSILPILPIPHGNSHSIFLQVLS